MKQARFIVSCLVSVGLHAGMLWLIPAPSLEPLALPAVPTDAELLVLDIPLPAALQALAAPAASSTEHSAATDAAYDIEKIVPYDREKLDGAIEKMSAGIPAHLPLPALQLPVPQSPESNVQAALPLPPSLAAISATIVEQSLQSPGVPSGDEKAVGWGEVRFGDKHMPSRLGLPTLDQRLIARTLPETPSPRPALPPLPQFGIQGPAARREPLYRPALPEVQVQAESEITLKFWVRPDGVVSRVLPERKGEATLEIVAIRYLEGWRFTPLPSHEPQVEQWGTITVRFLLRAR